VKYLNAPLKYLFLIFLFSFPFIVAAQTGNLKGNVKDKVKGDALIDVNVFIPKANKGALTELEGEYFIGDIPAGTYKVIFNGEGYNADTVSNVVIKPGETTVLDKGMGTDTVNTVSVVVVGQKPTDTEAAGVKEQQESKQVVNVMTGEQMAKSQGDRDLGRAIIRLPGVTINDGRFVVVRGLSERYNAVMLNNALTPSSENDVKAFSFDLIPTALVDRIMIYKSAAPELPGEFAGGVIKIFTRTPVENFVSVNYATSYRQNTTFKDFYSPQKGKTDWLGVDDGTRTLPKDFPADLSKIDLSNSAELTRVSKMLPNNWTVNKTNAMPDQRFSLSVSKVIPLGGIKLGNISSVNYTYTNQHFLAKRANFDPADPGTFKSNKTSEFNDQRYDVNVRLGLMHNWSVLFNQRHKIEFRNFYNQIGTSQTTLRTGNNYDASNELKSYGFRYETRKIYTGQLNGSHTIFNERTKAEWNLGAAITKRDEPDFRRVNTARPIGSADSVPFLVIIPTGASNEDAGRFYSHANEQLFMASADVEHKLAVNGKFKPVLKAGFYFEKKNKDFAARWMSYSRGYAFKYSLSNLPLGQIFAPENIAADSGFILKEGTNPTDSYTGENFLKAYYISLIAPINKKINFSGGFRVEDNTQTLNSHDLNDKKVEVSNHIIRLLPSGNISYNLDSLTLIRLAYFRTLNRPEFRELAPFAYYDFNFQNVLYGNPKLKTPYIDNLDLRLERYPRVGETVTLGFFYKRFTNPIESYFLSASGGSRNFTFNNASLAQSIGAELELRKSLMGISSSKILDKFSLLINGAVINSKVDLGTNAIDQTSKRPMMGQSPYAVNAGIFFTDTASRIQVNMLYNVIGKRLFAVGTAGNPDIYEMPRNVIDLNISKAVGKYLEVRFGISDLLNQSSRLKQDSNKSGKIDSRDEQILSFKRGSYYTLGFNLRF
jgi:hypothetical protein